MLQPTKWKVSISTLIMIGILYLVEATCSQIVTVITKNFISPLTWSARPNINIGMAAPLLIASKGAPADSTELSDLILLNQPLFDPSPGLSEDCLPPNIISQLCAVIVDNPAQT